MKIIIFSSEKDKISRNIHIEFMNLEYTIYKYREGYPRPTM